MGTVCRLKKPPQSPVLVNFVFILCSLTLSSLLHQPMGTNTNTYIFYSTIARCARSTRLFTCMYMKSVTFPVILLLSTRNQLTICASTTKMWNMPIKQVHTRHSKQITIIIAHTQSCTHIISLSDPPLPLLFNTLSKYAHPHIVLQHPSPHSITKVTSFFFGGIVAQRFQTEWKWNTWTKIISETMLNRADSPRRPTLIAGELILSPQ